MPQYPTAIHHADEDNPSAVEDDVLVADGSYLRSDEHVGGLWVLQAAHVDEATAALGPPGACRAPVEVRQFH